MQKTLDERLRNAKPDYVQVDKDRILSRINQATDTMPHQHTAWWRKKKLLVSIVIPLATISAVGFTYPHLWENNGSVKAYTAPTTAQMQLKALQASKYFNTNFGPFIHAKQSVNLPRNEIAHSHAQITPDTREVILMGVPFIRMDVIQTSNYALSLSKSEFYNEEHFFVVARHPVAFPSSEIAHSMKDENSNTKEILISGQPPLILWNVITPDNNANYYNN